MSGKPLAGLSQEKKEKLAALIEKFNLNTTEIVIKKGPNTGHWVKNFYGKWVVLRDRDGELMWPDEPPYKQAAAKAETVTGSGYGCGFKEGDTVTMKHGDTKQVFTVEKFIKQPFGRTQWWCKLNGCNKLIQSADLRLWINEF